MHVGQTILFAASCASFLLYEYIQVCSINCIALNLCTTYYHNNSVPKRTENLKHCGMQAHCNIQLVSI